MYSVFDTKSGVYDVPFFSRSDLFATRKFIMDCLNDQRATMLSNFKDDFELYCLGEFDQFNGVVESGVRLVLTGKEVKQ